MSVRLPLFVALLLSAVYAAPDDGLLCYFNADEGQGKVATDRSPNGLNATVTTAWAASPAGQAFAFDGQSAGLVRLQLPADKRFGKGSWALSAWLRPQQFTIKDAQNQRRLFAFGVYPDAYLVIDLMSGGQPSTYFVYKAANGQSVSAGSTAGLGLKVGEWSHVAVICDRQAGQVDLYVNGYKQGESLLPAEFGGDFSVGGELTLGNGWHNYWGLMDEVKVYRRALTRADVKAEFARLRDTFGIKESPEAAAAEKREALMADFAKTRGAWAKGDFAAVRAACAALYQSPDVPANLRSYAHLRAAQAFDAAGDLRAARAEYSEIAARADYPAVHRDEARELAQELERRAAGLPARNPAASRTKVDRVTPVAELWVAPNGSEVNDGTAEAPFATLTQARDKLRRLRANGVKGTLAVNIRPGTYKVTAPLELTAEDSRVCWRATEPGKAIFYGGTRISGFKPVTDPAILDRLPAEARSQVVCCDLKAQGLTDYGKLAVRGFGQPASPPTLELYVNGQAMTLARWPNKGFVGIKKLVEPGNKGTKKPSVIEYLDDRHARWTQADDAWLFGYFRYLWADATIKVSRIDPDARTLSCDEAYAYGGPGMHPGQGIAYYAFNLLVEIDQPGEWYLDRKSGMLYLYPPLASTFARIGGGTDYTLPTVDVTTVPVELGRLATPMVTATNVTDLRLEGLTFDLARYNGLELTDCSRCLIKVCTVRRFAGNGVMVTGGEANGLLGCDIHTIGRRATEVIGGDRATLTPGRHFVENCRIHNFGRIDRTYTPAIQLEGVGNRVAHCELYDGPSSVMRIEGNDHLMEYNYVHDAVTESDDQGGMELFGNPTYRGVVFRFNRYERIGRVGAGPQVHGQAAIRFDDAISGMLVYGNLFIRGANGNFGAIQMNSGRDNLMDNNVFVDCKQGVSGGWHAGNAVWGWARQKKAGIIMSDLYYQRYPEMKTMLDPPGVNRVWRNVFYRCGRMTTGNAAGLDLLENVTYTDQDPGFVDAAQGDWRFRPDAPVFASVGLRALPVGEMGLY